MTTNEGEKSPLEEIISNFRKPPASCRPHTRWWWMGNAASKEDITWQLEQMHQQGIGGVEQITMQDVYEKGNVPYLSQEYFNLVTHAIREAKRLGMEFSLNFGGPGWVIGGAWVPSEDRSKNMVTTYTTLRGPSHFSGGLPTTVGEVEETGEIPARDIIAEDRLVAVVAGRLVAGRLVESTLVDLTDEVMDRELEWSVPDGEWRLMAFWLIFTGQGNAIDHFDKAAMSRYCEFLGGRFREAFGEDFGTTVESLFVDSFEVSMVSNGIYWSDGLLGDFKKFKGYELSRYLPAIWWEVGEISPKIRYDVNEFLHSVGLEAFFKTFLDWCERNGIQGRIQPYGFTTDILQGAGLAHLPEMEITAGEKDAVPWFDTRIGPRKYVASGAHLYGRNIVTVEAYTYIHWESYRATLEELKIASDIFLKYGANKFYNHGYTCSPERDIAPSRRFESEVLISHSNVWWRYYQLLSEYVARCCCLLRQGSFVADVAVYSPLASQWTLDVRNARKWTRGFQWGSLGKLLLSNGHDFDLLNDDVIRNHAEFLEGVIRNREQEYKVLLLPNIRALPLDVFERIRDWVKKGGIAIALERVPDSSVGLNDHASQDEKVREIAEEMFTTPRWRVNPTAPRDYGKGRTYHIRHVIDRSDPLECSASALDPFLNAIRRHVEPDMGIDFVSEGIRENGGLTYIHRRMQGRDIYFVANVQDRPINMRVAFRVAGSPSEWDPETGLVRPVWEYEQGDGVTRIPLRLGPYCSTFIIFEDDVGSGQRISCSTFSRILRSDRGVVEAVAEENGTHALVVDGRPYSREVTGIPKDFVVDGEWSLTLEGIDFPKIELSIDRLRSWTEDGRTRHFSGTGRYEIEFELPAEYLARDILLQLDLGVVGNIAEAELNDTPVGIRWRRGQRLDITGTAKAGQNVLTVYVTNTLINRVAGLKDLPPLPDHLRPRYGGDLRMANSPSRRLLGYEPLPISGLIGPVTILTAKKLVILTDVSS